MDVPEVGVQEVVALERELRPAVWHCRGSRRTRIAESRLDRGRDCAMAHASRSSTREPIFCEIMDAVCRSRHTDVERSRQTQKKATSQLSRTWFDMQHRLHCTLSKEWDGDKHSVLGLPCFVPSS